MVRSPILMWEHGSWQGADTMLFRLPFLRLNYRTMKLTLPGGRVSIDGMCGILLIVACLFAAWAVNNEANLPNAVFNVLPAVACLLACLVRVIREKLFDELKVYALLFAVYLVILFVTSHLVGGVISLLVCFAMLALLARGFGPKRPRIDTSSG